MDEIHVTYEGHVQGVGFRLTTRRYAQGRKVSGWVRNKTDGTVEMIAQGSKQQLQSLLNDINRHFSPNITQADISWSSVSKKIQGFEISY